MTSIANSDGVNGSDGVNWSNGVNWSHGVNGSHGVNWGYGVNCSYGIMNSYGVDHAMFLADKPRTNSLFGTDVTLEHFNEVWSVYHRKLNGWFPKFNNAFELYLQNGNNWEKVDSSKIISTLNNREEPYEAWKDMPKEALAYLRSLPEFDAAVFERVTGIKVENELSTSKKKAEELRKKADELLLQAKELEESL